MTESIHSRIWQETPSPDNPFRPTRCTCAGYDVYSDLLGNASFTQYLLLLFLGEQPTPSQCQLLDSLAVAVANAGPRDHAVQAAMAAGASGSTSASCLMAAVAVGAGQLTGAREVAGFIAASGQCGDDMAQWQQLGEQRYTVPATGIWPTSEHPPGFDPCTSNAIDPVRQTLTHLAAISPGTHLAWLQQHRERLESVTGLGLAITAVAGAALLDLGLDAEAAEMLFLLLRLPGAAVHALEQRERGWRDFPFYHNGIDLGDTA